MATKNYSENIVGGKNDFVPSLKAPLYPQDVADLGSDHLAHRKGFTASTPDNNIVFSRFLIFYFIVVRGKGNVRTTEWLLKFMVHLRRPISHAESGFDASKFPLCTQKG